MGRLIDGKWVTEDLFKSLGPDSAGEFKREKRSFLESVSADHPKFQPESGRYHLYVSYACPWAHRCLIYRELKELSSHISVSVVHPDMLEMGWEFREDFDGSTGDTLLGKKYIHQVYQEAQSDVTTSASVPVLWDKKNNTIVNNESSQIIRIFNSEFNSLTGNGDDYYPEELRADIDAWNEKIYDNVNNGVYRCGFARSQEAYDDAITGMFDVLDELETTLEGKDYLIGNTLTEADLRLIPSLLRFDIVYVTHFKCNWKRIADYKNLSRYTQNLYEIDAIKKTTRFDHIKRHYYYSHESINPYRIIPKGPERPLSKG